MVDDHLCLGEWSGRKKCREKIKNGLWWKLQLGVLADEKGTFTPGEVGKQETLGLGSRLWSCCGQGAGSGTNTLTELACHILTSAGL